MSTPCIGGKAAAGARARALASPIPLQALHGPDPAEWVAHVARARRKALLHAHRCMLRYEDLEDCFGQALVELVGYVRAGGSFAKPSHVVAAIDVRFVSRVHDRRRAIRGRSPIQTAHEHALAGGSLDGVEGDIADVRCAVEELAMMRVQLRSLPLLMCELTADQRLVIACQVTLQMRRAEFCALFGWSHSKYRKVAYRARIRLRRLSEEFDESRLDGDPCVGHPPPPPAHARVPKNAGRPPLTRAHAGVPTRSGGRGSVHLLARPSVVDAHDGERAA